ncbi:MAG: hypothetical protein SOI44_05210 [Lactimicrobium sp.]|jgi:spore photoproduct lyase|uniref:SPL family radical SAM protein n=1 Tax=Lactimicrobium sp. TaxID=2563780 RepID=UPI002F360DE5
MSLKETLLQPKFTEIYVEEGIRTQADSILSHFPNAHIIMIQDYRDVFDRPRQSYSLQHKSQKLILARKKDGFLYPGSPVCQSFGNPYFMYSSCVMNCVYDCSYCFLKGMYPGGNLAVFVNLEDYFDAVEKELQKHSLYLCVSYDADLLSLESILGYGRAWSEFVRKHDNLTIEIRTKGTFDTSWQKMTVSDRTILAFTLSPETVIAKEEKGTPSLSARLAMLQKAMDLGFPVRICFDPVLMCPDQKQAYQDLVEKIATAIDLQKVRDFSLGSFRLSKVYMARMRRQYPDSAVLQYPYVCEKGFYHLPARIETEMTDSIVEALAEHGIGKEKIFFWRES